MRPRRDLAFSRAPGAFRVRRLGSVLLATLTAFMAVPAPVSRADSDVNARVTDGPAVMALGSASIIDVGPEGWSGESVTSDTTDGWGDDQWRITPTQPQQITVTVTDGYIVGDNFAVYVDGNLLGTTPAVPLRGPTYSTGTFTTTLEAGTHLITIQDVGGIAYYREGARYMIPAGYFVDVRIGGKRIIFVHGLNSSFRDNSFNKILGPLAERFPGSVRRFVYYQDKGSRDDSGVCRSIPVELPASGVTIPFDPFSIDERICDSQSDLGLNAVALDSYIRRQYSEGLWPNSLSVIDAQTGCRSTTFRPRLGPSDRGISATGPESGNQPVVLIANSMGAAIVRGFLAYSAEAGDGVATTMVDSVLYLQGAQDGSLWLNIDRFDRQLAPIQDALEPFARDAFPADLSRPAAGELAPVSLWYLWTNALPGHLPSLPSFNLFGDLRVVVKTELPFLGTLSADLAGIGDVALMPGTDDPRDVPPEGGARFLDGPSGAQNWQWAMTGQLAWEPFSEPFFGGLGFAEQVGASPIFHGNFGAQMDRITVPDCKSGLPTTVTDQLIRIVSERMSAERDNCAPYVGG